MRDSDDIWEFPNFRTVLPHLEVQDEGGELVAEVSPIIAPDGSKIVRHYMRDGQGFTGFVKPTWAGEEFYEFTDGDGEPLEGEDNADAE